MLTALAISAVPGALLRWLVGQRGVIAGLVYHIVFWAVGAFLLAQVGAARPGSLAGVAAAIGAIHLSAPAKYTLFPKQDESSVTPHPRG